MLKERWLKTSRSERRKEEENIYSPVAEVAVAVEAVEAPEAELEVVPETALAVEAVVPPALAATVLPAVAELAATVALAEAGQEAADGNFTLTLCKFVVSESRFR